MKTLQWSLDSNNRPMKDAYGEFQGRRKAEAEAYRRKRVANWQKWETNPMNKDQANYWRKGDGFLVLTPGGAPLEYNVTNPADIKHKDCLTFWNRKSARSFVENAERRGIPLETAIKDARIEYGWDEATVKESLTVQQEEPVKWIERKKGERGEIGDMVTYNINVDLQDRSIMTDRHILNSWCCIGGGVEKYLRAGEKVPGCLTGRVRIRYLNPEWVEWNRKNEKQVKTEQTPADEKATEKLPLPDFKNEDEEREFWATHSSVDYLDWSKAEKLTFTGLNKIAEQLKKESVTALLRVEIEKRNLRIDKMRKAINEAIKEVQAIELTIQLVEKKE